jgi:hypothetical protein
MLDQEPAVEFHPHGHTILLMVLESAQQKNYFISQKSYHPNQEATCNPEATTGAQRVYAPC